MKIDIAKKEDKIKFFRKYSEFKYKLNYSALSERKECVEGYDDKLIIKTKREPDPGLLSNMGSREIYLTGNRPLKWRVRMKLGTEIKGIEQVAQIKKRNPKRIGHLRKGNYDRELRYLKEQIYMRKNIVKKKIGNYDLGLFRGEDIQKNRRFKTKGSYNQVQRLRVLSHSIPVHYTKERSVLEHMNLGTNSGKY